MLPCADYVRLPGVGAEFGAHARIRTGDLFLTKWPGDPGEFELILARNCDFGRDHLTSRALWGANIRWQ